MQGRRDRVFRHPGEARALEFLESRSHVLLRHNYHTGYAEIDLLTVEASLHLLHVVEVKAWGGAGEVVHPTETFLMRKKREGLRRAALHFLGAVEGHRETAALFQEHGLDVVDLDISFDLAWVRDDSVEWFPELF